MKAIKPNLNFGRKEIIKLQSVEVKGQPGVRRSPLVGDDEFVEYLYDDARTVLECFIRGIKESDNGPCYGYRPGKKEVPYEWVTYKEVWESAKNIGSGMLEKGLNSDNFIGIYSQNTVEWGIMDKGCCAYSLVSVPLYDTLGEEAVQFIINQCELSLVMVDCPSKAKRLIEYQKEGHIKSLKHIVIVDDLDQETISLAEDAGVAMVTWKDLETLGQENLKETIPPKLDDLYTICYTSGTSGTPKGVMMTHKMLVAEAAAAMALVTLIAEPNKDDMHFSYLPLAHSYERFSHVVVHITGGSVAFYRGDPKLLMSDIAAAKPTNLNLVPRVMNKIHDKLLAQVNQSFVKSKLFHFAFNRKMADLKQGILRNDTIWDKLVFSKTRALVGGRLKYSFSGAAAISPDVLNFTRIVFGVPIGEGYGLTEGAGSFSCTPNGDFSGGNVGSPFSCCHLKLIDVPDMEYFASDNKGEICATGPIIMKGYYKEPEKTKEALDDEGWLHTGDIGEWLPNGSLRIIDRKKHIFKLSQGEYIAPEKLEQVFQMMAPVAQVFVHGESLKSSLVGIVVPDEETIFNWCKEQRISVSNSSEEICKNKKVNATLVKELQHFGKHHGLKSFELLKRIYLSSELFSVDNNLLTPTFKTRRKQIVEKYRSQLDQLYNNLD